jgi:hypothetical protein
MQTVTELALLKAQRGIFTRMEAECWLSSTGARVDALIKRAVAATEILRIRRGLYVLSTRYHNKPVHPFEVAQQIHGPSYISLESALAYHEWIPETVQTVTSACVKRSVDFHTPLGTFSFSTVPQVSFFTGVQRVSDANSSVFLIATPLKALADYVCVYQHPWTSLAPVIDSLRIDEAFLQQLTGDMFDNVVSAYRSARVRLFLKSIRKELHK